MNTINYSSNGLSLFHSDSRFAGINGNLQTVAIIDQGFKVNHPGFGPDCNRDGAGDRILRSDIDFDTVNGNNYVGDNTRHGTLTAGVLASTAKGVRILPIQIGQTVSGITSGVEYATAMSGKYNIKVISISLSDGNNTLSTLPTALTKPFYTAVRKAEEAGITVVAANGNSYQGYGQRAGASGLAELGNVIGVSGVQSDGITDGISLYPNSQRTPTSIGAPGYGVTSFRDDNNDYIASAGTSIATPFVSGSIALLQGVAERYLRRSLTPSEVKSLLTQTDTDLPATPGQTQINVYNAADLIHKIATGAVPDTLSKTPLTNIAHTFPQNPTRFSQNIWGSNYNDVLTGKSIRQNNFVGGGGKDLIIGGKGFNNFVYNAVSDGGDTILNFVPGKDKLNIKELLTRENYKGTNPLIDGTITLGSIENGRSTLVSFDKDAQGLLPSQPLAIISDVNAWAMYNPNNFVIS